MPDNRLANMRSRRIDAPLDVLHVSKDWLPVVDLFGIWARLPLGSDTGYTAAELDELEAAHKVRFPVILREWWRLAGKHPFVLSSGLEFRSDSSFQHPIDVACGPKEGLTIIAIDDGQTGMVTGIHDDFLSDVNPLTHGRNPNWIPPQAYRDEFQATGLTATQLIHTTLLCHFCMAAGSLDEHANKAAFVDGVTFIKPEKERHSMHDADIRALGLQRFAHEPAFGHIYSNLKDIIFYWLSGYLCLTDTVAEHVRATISEQ